MGDCLGLAYPNTTHTVIRGDSVVMDSSGYAWLCMARRGTATGGFQVYKSTNAFGDGSGSCSGGWTSQDTSSPTNAHTVFWNALAHCYSDRSYFYIVFSTFAGTSPWQQEYRYSRFNFSTGAFDKENVLILTCDEPGDGNGNYPHITRDSSGNLYVYLWDYYKSMGSGVQDGKIYKSTDSGDNWSNVKTVGSGVPNPYDRGLFWHHNNALYYQDFEGKCACWNDSTWTEYGPTTVWSGQWYVGDAYAIDTDATTDRIIFIANRHRIFSIDLPTTTAAPSASTLYSTGTGGAQDIYGLWRFASDYMAAIVDIDYPNDEYDYITSDDDGSSWSSVTQRDSQTSGAEDYYVHGRHFYHDSTGGKDYTLSALRDIGTTGTLYLDYLEWPLSGATPDRTITAAITSSSSVVASSLIQINGLSAALTSSPSIVAGELGRVFGDLYQTAASDLPSGPFRSSRQFVIRNASGAEYSAASLTAVYKRASVRITARRPDAGIGDATAMESMIGDTFYLFERALIDGVVSDTAMGSFVLGAVTRQGEEGAGFGTVTLSGGGPRFYVRRHHDLSKRVALDATTGSSKRLRVSPETLIFPGDTVSIRGVTSVVYASTFYVTAFQEQIDITLADSLSSYRENPLH